jgi:hypothetical protein
MMAAMKKVLSPISETRIMPQDLRNPCFVFWGVEGEEVVVEVLEERLRSNKRSRRLFRSPLSLGILAAFCSSFCLSFHLEG